MPSSTHEVPTLEFYPVTAERLADLARFSAQHGKFRYCSCMRWRMTSADYQRSTKASRVAALDELVRRGTPVGVLAYVDGDPVGWCSIASRETYTALERSRALPRVDDAPVWSVVCFFVDRRVRRQGVTLGLLKAAVEYARSHTEPRSSRDIRSSPVRACTPTWARRRRSDGWASTMSPLPARPGRSCAASWAPSHARYAGTSTSSGRPVDP
jgi:GNAT superfamily N-acetyltransferase